MLVCYSGDRADRRGARADPRTRRPDRRPAHEQPYTSCSRTSTAPSPRASTTTGRPSIVAELSDDAAGAPCATFAESAPIPEARIGIPPSRRGAQRRARRTTARSATATLASCSASTACGSRASRTPRRYRRWVRDAWERRAALLDRAQLHQLPDRRRGRGAGARDVRRELRPSRRDQAELRSANLFRVNRNVDPGGRR